MPNPATGPFTQLRFKLAGPADRVQVRLYSRAFVALNAQDLPGAWGSGWNSLSLDLRALGAGAGFVVLQASQGGQKEAPAPPLKVFRLR